MNNNLKIESEIWNLCKEDLRKQYPVSLYNRFIEPLQFSIHSEKGQSDIQLITPDAGSMRHIEKKYLKDITDNLLKHNIQGQISLRTITEKKKASEKSWSASFHPHSENMQQVQALITSEFPDTLAFIWGQNGSGKTTLAKDLQQNAINNNQNSLSISYTRYLEEFSAAITSKKMVAWKNKIRSYQLLIIDDFQSVKPGSQKTQEELRFLINDYQAKNHKVIIFSDTAHTDLPLADILKSRLDSAFNIRLFIPDSEARSKIIYDAMNESGLSLSVDITDKISHYLALRIKDSGWKLRSAVQRIFSLGQEYIHLLTIESQWKGVIDSVCSELYTVAEVSPDELLKTVARFYNVTEDAIRGPARDKKYVEARHVFSWLCYNHLNLKLISIAHLIQRRDHSAVLHGVNKIDQKLKEDLFFQSQIRRIAAESGL
jgi:chromosomal replication initiator protein